MNKYDYSIRQLEKHRPMYSLGFAAWLLEVTCPWMEMFWLREKMVELIMHTTRMILSENTFHLLYSTTAIDNKCFHATAANTVTNDTTCSKAVAERAVRRLLHYGNRFYHLEQRSEGKY